MRIASISATTGTATKQLQYTSKALPGNPEYVKAVSLHWVDSSGNTVWGGVNLGIQEVGAESVALGAGKIEGSENWNGSIPLREPMILFADFYYPASGDVVTMNVLLDEVP